jgi:hypothetical protein
MEEFKFELDDWTKFEDNTIEYMIRQAEMNHKFLEDQGVRITQRAYALLAYVITYCTIIIGFVLKSEVEGQSFNPPILITTIILVVVASAVLSFYFLIKCLFPYNTIQLGNRPKYFEAEKYVNDKQLEGLQLKAILLSRLENFQIELALDDEVNQKRLKYLKRAIWTITITLAIVLSLTLVLIFT